MYRSCHTQKTAEQQILFERALLSIMQEKPYDKISVVDLCTYTGLSRRIFYRLFDTKLDALTSQIDHTLMSYSHFEPVGCRNETQKYLLFWKTNSNWLDVIIKNGFIDILLERLIYLVTQEDLPLQNVLGATDTKYRRNVLIFNLGGLMGLIVDWHNSGYLLSTDELALLIRSLMTNPLVKPI